MFQYNTETIFFFFTCRYTVSRDLDKNVLNVPLTPLGHFVCFCVEKRKRERERERERENMLGSSRRLFSIVPRVLLKNSRYAATMPEPLKMKKTTKR